MMTTTASDAAAKAEAARWVSEDELARRRAAERRSDGDPMTLTRVLCRMAVDLQMAPSTLTSCSPRLLSTLFAEWQRAARRAHASVSA